MPSATKSGYDLGGWYTQVGIKGTKVTADNDVLLNQHTLYARWLGDPHDITIDSGDHGTINADPEKPREGEEVTITLTPDEDYEQDGVPVIKDEDGNEIELMPTENPGEYRFMMPDSDVTVSAKFVPKPTPTPPGPEPGPTPEPTPDPSVDPDGGSGASSKTSDPFMEGTALALLGITATGAVILRKRK